MSSFWDRVDKVNEQKKAAEEEEKKKKEEKSSDFWDRVDKVNNGTITVNTSMSGDDVTNWYKSVTQTSKQAYDYLSKEGYKAPNSDYLKDIDSYLAQADHVGQYIRANKNAFSDYDKTLLDYHETVNYLRSLKDSVESSNKLYSQWDTEDAYNNDLRDYGFQQQYGELDYDGVVNAMEYKLEGTDEYEWLKNRATAIMPYETAIAKRDAATNNDERLYYTDLANQKAIERNAKILSEATMDGTNISVLDEMYLVADMPDGAEKDKRKAAILSKMEELGVSTKDYAFYAGDSNVTWEDFWNWAGSAAASGLNSFNKGITGTLDLLLGRPMQALGWKDNPISSIAGYYSDLYNNYKYDTNYYAARMGGGAGFDIGGQLVEGTVGAIPDALLAIMTSGYSKAGSISNACVQASGNFLQKAGVTVQNMAKNPQFWVSYARTYSSDYEEAKSMGADDVTAAFGATLSSLINAGIEIGFDGASGIQGLPQEVVEGGKSAILSWVKSSLEEGGEEVLQGFINNAVAKMLYNSDTELANLGDMATEFAMGTAVGGLLGGGQIGLQNTINTGAKGINTVIENRRNKRVYGNTEEDLRLLIAEGLESAEGSQSRILAEKLKQKLDSGKTLSGSEISQLVKANDEAIRLEETAEMKAETEAQLKELGETGDVSAIADIIVKRAYGEDLTSQEWEILANSKHGSTMARSLASGNKVNRVNVGNYDDALMNLAQEVASNASRTKQGQQAGEFAPSDGNLIPEAESASEAHYEVSEDGRMVNTETGEAIDPQGLVQAKDGTYMIATKDAEPVSSSKVSYESIDQALVFETLVNLESRYGKTSRVIADMDLDSRNALLALYNPQINKDGGKFINGILDSYFYGHRGVDLSTASKDSPMWELTEQQRKIAWNTGRAAGIKADTNVQSNVDTAYAEAKEILKSGKAKKGSYHAALEDGISPTELNNTQKAVYRYADEIAQSVQTNIRVYKGKNKAQGFYNHETDEIWLNLNAANTGREAIMAFTLAHELVHRAKKGSPVKYQAFVDFLMKEYGKQGSNVEAMIAEQIQAAEEFNKTVPEAQRVNMTREKALEEVVCDACQRMLLDTNAGQKLAEFGAQSKENKSFLEDLKRWITELLDKLRNYFRNAEPDSLAAKAFAKFDANAKQILADMYVDMSIDAGEKLSTIKAAFGEEFADKFFGVKDIRYNLAAVDSHKAKMQKEFSEDSSTDLKTIMARYDKIIDIWTRLGGELNSKFLAEWNSKVGKDRSFTIFKAQAGYKYNVELSSMCKKGVPLFEAIDTIVKQEVMKELGTEVLGKAEKEILYDILKQHHFEIPCAICYVEQARQREGVIIDAFLNGKVEKNTKGETTKVKLGWNQVLDSIQKEMKANGVDYTFAQVSRDIATDKYSPAILEMDEKTTNAFYAALKKIANQEISRYNKAEGKSRKLLTDVTPAAVKECFKGTLPSNLKIFKVLFNESKSRFKIQNDLLYSSLTTQNLSMAHNELYGLFNSQGGVSGYKTKQGTTIYWGDILGKSWKPDTLRNEGGVRNQSNSDFQMYTLLDQAQMYLDFTAKGYYLQAYTKVLSELKLFGLSRGKINASLIPKVVVYYNADGSVDIEKTMATAGLDENGNPIYDDIEGINHDEAFMLIEDPEYSKSICGICIGYSDAHINKLLDDNRVQQIIGFHDKTDDGTKRYKGARYAKNYNGLNEAVNKEGKTVHIGFNPYVKRAEKKFKFNAETETFEGTVNYNGQTYTADDIPRLATALYLEMCAKKEYTPAYKDFAGHRNYYKLLADFGLYDSQGHYAPHRKVVYNMPDTVPYLDANGKKRTMKTYDYIKAELEKELAVRDSISEALADTSSEGIIPQFKAAVKKAQEEKSFSLPKGDPAPTFYSLMAKVVDGVKQEKLGAASVVSMLRGKGVKAEEIKWSGIEAWLEGKKSVTKTELQEFIAGSMLQIEEEVLDNKDRPYTEDQKKRLGEYKAKQDEVTNRVADEWKRITGKDLPISIRNNAASESGVVNAIMDANKEHKDASFEGRLLKKLNKDLREVIEINDYFGFDSVDDALHSIYRHRRDFIKNIDASTNDKAIIVKYCNALNAYNELPNMISDEDADRLRAIARDGSQYSRKAYEVMREHDKEQEKYTTNWDRYKINGGKNYREMLFRIPGSTYSNESMYTHWKERKGVLAHARVQDMDTFLGKMLFIEEIQSDWHNEGHKKEYQDVPDAPFKETYHEYVMKRLLREAAEQDYDSIGWTPADVQMERWNPKRKTNAQMGLTDAKNPDAVAFEEGYRIEYDQDIPKFLSKYGKKWDTKVGKTVLDNGTEVWSMAITDSMKDSVLYDGQVMYSLPKNNVDEDADADYYSLGLEDISGLVKRGAGIKWNNGNTISLGKAEYAAVVSRISTGYNSRKTHGGVQYIERSTDGKDASMFLYLFIDHGFGDYEIIARLNYSRQDELIHRLRRIIQNGRNAGEVLDGTEQLRDIDGSIDSSGVGNQNGSISKTDDKKAAGRSGHQQQRDNGRAGSTDSGRLDERGNRPGSDEQWISNKLPVGEDTSPRALLANAFEGIITNDIEKQKIQEYKGKVEMLNAEEQKLHELRAQIKELSFAKGKRDTKKIKELQFDAVHTENRIATLDKVLLRLEAATPLQNILKREKEMAYKRAEQKGKEALKAYREAEAERDKQWHSQVKDKYQASKKQAIETREKRDAREKLQKLVLDTVKWITYPTKTDVKCPDILKQPYADFLNGIDLSSKRLANGGDPTKNDLRLANAMGSLATALDKIMTSQDPAQDTDKVLDTGYLDLPADFVAKLRDMTENVKAMMTDGDYVVNNMSAAEVRQLSQMIRTLNHAIKEVSTLYANLRFANVEALGDSTMSFMDDLGEIEKTGGIKDFVQWDNALPYYAFKRFGEGGESIFEGLMDAQDKLAFLAQKIFDFQEKAWTGKEAKEWSEDTHEIDLPNGSKLTLTTADAMSIYCLSRREQGLQHLLGGGTRVMGIQKGSKKAKDSRSLLTIKDIEAINESLTDRQRAVAEAIQEFMSTVCSDWGNEISMKRFLTKEFTEKFYFPIESNDENLPTKDPSAQQSDLFRLLNISATKPLTPGANNEVIIRNIFDVFTGHASDMARLNSYGMALLDYMKWLNYREKAVNEEGQIKVRGVRKSMEQAYGNAAKSYVLNLIKDVNGRPSDGGLPSFYTRMLRNAKTAMVGNSLRVATLQITSYPRAALVLSPKSLALGLSKLPQIEKAKKYCGIALWKSFGFYDTNISRSIEDQMKGVKDVKQKLIELSLKGAEWGDAITWGCLWNACEYEVAKTTKNKVGSEEFYQEVGKKLREVVYRTQVVDSTLTRSEMMRSKNAKAQELSAFMSEPTLSANILMDAGFQFEAEKRRTGSVKAAWKKTSGYIIRSVTVYGIGQLAAALLEGLWDAWRDEDDEEFGEKFLDAFVENLVLDLVPFNKIPIISDMAEAAMSLVGLGYFSSDSLSSTALSQTVSAVDAWADVISGNTSATAYNALYKTMRAVSSFYGVSFSGLMREGVALWNNTAGAYDITWKLRTWDLSDADLAGEALDAILEGDNRQVDSIRAEFPDEESYLSAMRTAIKNRYTAGEIDYDTALQYLVKYGGMEEDAAYWKAEEWQYEGDTGEDFSKYNEFFTAVETGKNLKAVIKKYTDNGVKVETLASQITSHFKPIYTEMTTSQRASVKGYLLNAYELCGLSREDAEERIAKWQYEADYPELADEISYTQYRRWETDGKPNGVSFEMFAEVAEFRDDGTSNSVKSQEEVALYISAVTSDRRLRHALWCCFYKASTSPWR